MLKLDDCEEQMLIWQLRRMRDMLLSCNETVHSLTSSEIKANYVDWMERWHKSPYCSFETVDDLRGRSFARKCGSGQAAISMGLEYIEKILQIIKDSREYQEDDND